MKKTLKTFGIFLLILVSFQSCTPDDIYYNLSEDAKGFLLFDVNDTFKLKNIDTNEIITLTIISNKNSYFEVGPNESSFVYLGPRADVYVESATYKFTDNSHCYYGEVTVIADVNGGYLLKVEINGCFGNEYYSNEYQNEFVPIVDVEGIQYQNAYLLRSYPNLLYYSKEKGILKIVNESNQTKFSYVE